MDFLIVLSIIIAMYLMGKFAIDEGQKIERQKELEKNLKDWDKKKQIICGQQLQHLETTMR